MFTTQTSSEWIDFNVFENESSIDRNTIFYEYTYEHDSAICAYTCAFLHNRYVSLVVVYAVPNLRCVYCLICLYLTINQKQKTKLPL